MSSRISAAPHSTGNVRFGTRFIANARMSAITRIIAAPARLISTKLIRGPLFQLTDDLAKLFYLRGGELLPAQQGREQLVGAAIRLY